MRLRHLLAAGLSLAFMSLTACGTTYSLPEVSEGSEAQARTMFAAEQSKTHRAKTSSQAAVARLERVASRVKPVASLFCRAACHCHRGGEGGKRRSSSGAQGALSAHL